MGGSCSMVGGVSEKEFAVAQFLGKDEAFDKARLAHEQASRLEDAARTDWHKAKENLAKSVGYKAGDPPVSILVGDGRIIRLYTRQHDRCRDYDRGQEISISIEKVV